MAYNNETGMYEGFIYCITNNINGKKYIGQTTTTISKRWQQHKYRSSLSNSHNKYLYSSIKLHGIDNFNISEVEKVSYTMLAELKNSLNLLEIDYIKKYNTVAPNGYNITSGADCNPTYLTSIKIAQTDVNNKIIEYFDSIKQAQEKLGISYGIIKRCCDSHRIKEKYNCFFYYKSDYDNIQNGVNCENVCSCYEESDRIYRFKNGILLYQFDRNYNIINSFHTYTEAALYTHIGYSIISKSCKEMKILDKYKFGFCFANRYEEIKKGNKYSFYKSKPHKFTKPFVPKRKPVFQFTYDGTLIKKYDSIYDVVIENNYSKSSIDSVLTGNCNSAHGYLWSHNSGIKPDTPRYQKISHAVNQIDSNGLIVRRYKSIVEAATLMGVSPTSISCVCRGITKHSAGYKWEYSNNIIES